MLALLLFCTTKKILKSSGGLPFGIGMNEAYLRSCIKITDEHVIINISFVEQLTLLLSWSSDQDRNISWFNTKLSQLTS